MRKYGLYDATRGLTILVAVGAAGLLLWTATQVGQQTTGRFWGEMGIVAAAGIVLSLAHAVGSWTKGMRIRLSPGTFVLGFLPVLVCAGWILLAAQPGNGWHDGRFLSWSSSIGVLGVVHALGLWNGVLAFSIGLVLGLTIDSVPAEVVADAPAVAEVPTAEMTPRDRWVSDEPLVREREAAHNAEPKTVVVGPRDDGSAA